MSWIGYLREKLTNVSFDFIHFKDQWMNRFTDLQEAYDTGYANFTANLGKGQGGMPKDVIEDVGEVMANVAVAGMALQGSAGMVAIPLVFGIKKLAGYLHTEQELPNFDLKVEKAKLKEVTRTFRLATEYASTQLKKLRDLAIRLSGNADPYVNQAAEYNSITETISKLLLSPIWYPPKPSATDPKRMALPFEMRMWFRYWKYLNDTEYIWAHNMTKLPNLGPMFKRLKQIGWRPEHMTYQGKTVKLINWDKVDEYFEMSSWNQDIFAFQPVYEAIKLLPAYVEHKGYTQLRIPHKFPQEVEEYFQKVQKNHVGYDAPMPVVDHLLSPATMTWAAMTAWQPGE